MAIEHARNLPGTVVGSTNPSEMYKAALVWLTPLPRAAGKARVARNVAARAPNAGENRRPYRSVPESAPRLYQLRKSIVIWKATTIRPEKMPIRIDKRRKRWPSVKVRCFLLLDGVIVWRSSPSQPPGLDRLPVVHTRSLARSTLSAPAPASLSSLPAAVLKQESAAPYQRCLWAGLYNCSRRPLLAAAILGCVDVSGLPSDVLGWGRGQESRCTRRSAELPPLR